MKKKVSGNPPRFWKKGTIALFIVAALPIALFISKLVEEWGQPAKKETGLALVLVIFVSGTAFYFINERWQRYKKRLEDYEPGDVWIDE